MAAPELPLMSSVPEEQMEKASTSSEKPTVVRIKRKRNDVPIESLWLEVTGRPSKRHTLDLKSLALSDATTDTPDESVSTKLLLRRVESVTSSGAKEFSLPRLLEKVKERKRPREVSENDTQTKKTKDHQHWAKSTRFEQVSKNARGEEKLQEEDDTGRELFHLYDVVRVDVEVETAAKASRREKAKREAELTEGQLLCNYLPLLREHFPDLASEIDATAASAPTVPRTEVSTEEYVYDVYTVDERTEDDDEEDEIFYPTVQVLHHDDYDWRDSKDSDHDSEDSNDENNPNNDYPEEEEEEEEEEEYLGDGFDSDSSSYDFVDRDPYGRGVEEYDTSISDDETDIWKPRK